MRASTFVPGASPRSARARYIRIAVDLAVRQQGGRTEVPYLAARVQLADVAAALGRSRTAMYRLWETQHDFWVDLTLYLAFQQDLVQSPTDMPWHAAAEALAAVRVDGDDGIEVVRQFGNAGHEQLDTDPWFLVRAGLLGYADVPGLPAIRREIEARRMDLLGWFAQGVLTSIGRAVAPPYTAADLATVLWCAADAQRVRRHLVPDADTLWWLRIDEGHGVQDWSLWAYLSRAALFDLSTPTPTGGEPSPSAPPPAAATVIDPFARWSAPQRQALAVATELLVADLTSLDATIADGAAAPDDHAVRDLGVLGHVTIARVAAAAGVSRRAVYDVWPTRTAMLLDLLEHELAARRGAMVQGLDRALHDDDGRAAIARLIDGLVANGPRDGTTTPDVVLAFAPAAAEPHVREIFVAGHARYIEDCAARVQRIVDASQRGLRPGIGAEHVALLWVNMIEGGRRLLRTHPGALQPASAARPSALGAAAVAVFDHATAPH